LEAEEEEEEGGGWIAVVMEGGDGDGGGGGGGRGGGGEEEGETGDMARADSVIYTATLSISVVFSTTEREEQEMERELYVRGGV